MENKEQNNKHDFINPDWCIASPHPAQCTPKAGSSSCAVVPQGAVSTLKFGPGWVICLMTYWTVCGIHEVSFSFCPHGSALGGGERVFGSCWASVLPPVIPPLGPPPLACGSGRLFEEGSGMVSPGHTHAFPGRTVSSILALPGAGASSFPAGPC